MIQNDFFVYISSRQQKQEKRAESPLDQNMQSRDTEKDFF